MSTRVSQRWRKPSNQINNTVDSVSDKIDFLISAPYADKLPPKVAELIRKEIPFAVLLPLSLLNEIKRTGKTSINKSVRKKRLYMKLIIAELIRKEIPFAVLLPLSLLNEIKKTGKTSINKSVRKKKKRLYMKLIIATSLGQGWLINHPECRVDNSTHAVFSTACSANELLHNKGTEAFHKWMESTSGAKIAPKSPDGGMI